LDSQKPDDIVLKNALVNLVLDELEGWDGTVIEEIGTEENRQKRQTHAGLRLCLALDTFANTVTCYVRFKTSKRFPEEGLNFICDGNSHTWSCTETHQGWSKILKDYQTQPPLKLNGSSLNWITGASFRDPENSWRAKLRGATTRLFIPGRFEGFSDWIEKQRLERNIDFRIASYGDDVEKVREWGAAGSKAFKELTVQGLPDGWKLFSGKNATQSCPGIDILSISSTIRLLIRGGIKTGMGNAYLRFAPPYIAIENGSGDEKVFLNDIELKKEDSQMPVWYLPQVAPVAEPLHITVSVQDHILKRMVRLEEPELPLITEYKLRRSARGEVCQTDPSLLQARGAMVLSPQGHDFPHMPFRLPLYLSNSITFIGARRIRLNWLLHIAT